MNIKNNKFTITSFDIFILFNTLLFLFMCIFVYYDRFITYRGSDNILEFFIYASFIFAIIAVSWMKFRYLHVNIPLLLMIEFGILMHFAGAFVQIDGHRLYDSRFFEILEFFVTLTVKHNGVGTYNNNMLDLVANLCGALTAAFLYTVLLQKKIKLYAD